jgi:hypothetical protein
MGSYQGQATLVLEGGVRIDGQASVRTSKHLWEGTIVVGPAEHEQVGAVTRIELPTGEVRPVEITTSEPNDSGAFVVTFVSRTPR